jgi:hypothetical protein
LKTKARVIETDALFGIRSAAIRVWKKSSLPSRQSNFVVAGVPPAFSLKQPKRLPL